MAKNNKHMPINMGIFAHVDGGKTTITETILYKTGIINKIGRVDQGNTQTDNMDIERRRGISIKSVTTSFTLDDMKINLIDTPGHVDFVAEVERTINILDCAILVISGREGVQTQTKVLWNALRKLEIPTIIFINKLDRIGASYRRVLNEIKSELSDNVILMQQCNNEETRNLEIIDYKNRDKLLHCLSNLDDIIFEKFIDDEYISSAEFDDSLNKYTNQAQCYPIFLGSALLDIGVNELLKGIKRFFLTKKQITKRELSGVIFKIDKDQKGNKIFYARIFEGVIKNRSSILVVNKNKEVKVKNLKRIINGVMLKADQIEAGDIAIIYGLDDITIGDVLGSYSERINFYSIPKTVLCSKIEPVNKSDLPKLVNALVELNQEDPMLQFVKNPLNNELSINLIGQIQMEVIKSILDEKYNIEAYFSQLEVIYKERPIKTGKAHVKYRDNHPFPAEIGLSITPLPVGSGLQYETNVTYGYILKPFQNAVRDAVYDAAKEGLFGWEVTDALVSFNSAVYDSVNSTPSDFRKLTPIVFMEALVNASTKILEPRYNFSIRIKENEVGRVIHDLQKMRAIFNQPIILNNEVIIRGLIPIETSYNYRIKLASFTNGKGVFETTFAGYYESNHIITKTRERTKVNPINRSLYIKSL